MKNDTVTTFADGWHKVTYPQGDIDPDVVLVRGGEANGESVDEWIRYGFGFEPVHVLTQAEYAKLKADADPEALTIAYAKGYSDAMDRYKARIAELEAQGAWEPVGHVVHEYPDDMHELIYANIDARGRVELRYHSGVPGGEIREMAVMLPSDLRICRRVEAQQDNT